MYYDQVIANLLDRMGVAPLQTLSQQPGIQTGYRVVVYYVDGRAAHSVATLLGKARHADQLLTVVYAGLFDGRALRHTVPRDAYERFTRALQRVRFDQLDDQSATLVDAKTVWRVERASGALYRRVLLTPHTIETPYTAIVNAIDDDLAAAIREIPA